MFVRIVIRDSDENGGPAEIVLVWEDRRFRDVITSSRCEKQMIALADELGVPLYDDRTKKPISAS